MKGYILRDESLAFFNKIYGVEATSVIICFDENEVYCIMDGMKKMMLTKEETQKFI